MEKIVNELLKEELYYEKLENGLDVYFMPKRGFTKKYAVLATNYGSNDLEFIPIGETEPIRVNEGIAHFLEHKMFEQESEIIRRLAKDGNCIILGRCADAVLQGNENVCSVFVCANDEYREERGRTVYDGKSVIELNQEDAKRAEYYAYYTGKEWGNPKNYDLSVNTSHKSLEDIADVIIEYINKK